MAAAINSGVSFQLMMFGQEPRMIVINAGRKLHGAVVGITVNGKVVNVIKCMMILKRVLYMREVHGLLVYGKKYLKL